MAKMLKNIQIWVPSYMAQTFQRRAVKRPLHIMFCIADHFEPRWGGVSRERELEKVDTFIEKYSRVALRHRDAGDNQPRYTFFYPVDEFTPAVFEKITEFCKRGFGEIELQLHHDGDTSESLRAKLEDAKRIFSRYGALSTNKITGEIQYGFIHGNWALDNSRRDGRWCGVNNELEILRDTGCYADFTLPSAPSDTQTAKINSIYYAKDTPAPKSHNTGVDVKVLGLLRPLRGGFASLRTRPSLTGLLAMTEKDLMIIQGPLALNWKRMKIENSCISSNNPPAKDRIDLWINRGIGVRGKGEWIFVKVYAHGAQDANLTDGYFKELDNMFSYLEENYDDGINYKLHYVTARELYNIVKATEAGENGDPERYRDYILESNIEREVAFGKMGQSPAGTVPIFPRNDKE